MENAVINENRENTDVFGLCITLCSSGRFFSQYQVCQNCYAMSPFLHCIEHCLHFLPHTLLPSALLQHINRALVSTAIMFLISACPVAKLKLLKPGNIRGEPGHALMACKGQKLSFFLPTGKSKTDGSHFWNVLLYSCLLKCKVNLSRNRIL